MNIEPNYFQSDSSINQMPQIERHFKEFVMNKMELRVNIYPYKHLSDLSGTVGASLFFG